MARRSATNERYQKNTAPAGKTRRSAASAKPSRSADDAGSSSKGTASSKGKSTSRPAFSIHPSTPEYKKIRRLWWGFMGAAIVLSTASWWIWRQPVDRNIGTGILILAYASIGIAIWIDWTKMRPLRQEWAREQAKSKKS